MDNVLWPLNMTTKRFKSVTFYHPVGSAKMFRTVLLQAIMLQDKELGFKFLITDSLSRENHDASSNRFIPDPCWKCLKRGL